MHSLSRHTIEATEVISNHFLPLTYIPRSPLPQLAYPMEPVQSETETALCPLTLHLGPHKFITVEEVTVNDKQGEKIKDHKRDWSLDGF